MLRTRDCTTALLMCPEGSPRRPNIEACLLKDDDRDHPKDQRCIKPPEPEPAAHRHSHPAHFSSSLPMYPKEIARQRSTSLCAAPM